MPASPSIATDAANAVQLHTTVFYDPNLFHYVSSGWDLGELLSRRVCTSTSAFVPLVVPVPLSREESGVDVHKMGASQLRRAALRALLLSSAVDVNGGKEKDDEVDDSFIASDAYEASADVSVDDSLEAALDRWMPFLHLHVHGGKRLPAAQTGGFAMPSQNISPFVIIVDDTAPFEAPPSASVLSTLQSQQETTNKSMVDSSLRRKPVDKASQWPVVVHTASAVTVTLVLSFVKDAQTWRKLRRDARRVEAVNSSSPSVVADGATHNEGIPPQQQQQQHGSRLAPPPMFVSDDDALFTQWLHSKRASRLQWRRRFREEVLPLPALNNGDDHHEPSSPINGNKAVLDTADNPAVSLVLAHETSSSSEGEELEGVSAIPQTNESGADCSDPRGDSRRTVDAEARRAAVLAAIARRSLH